MRNINFFHTNINFAKNLPFNIHILFYSNCRHFVEFKANPNPIPAFMTAIFFYYQYTFQLPQYAFGAQICSLYRPKQYANESELLAFCTC
jgi:hypothetical protein